MALTTLWFFAAIVTKSTELWAAGVVFAVVVSVLWSIAPRVCHVDVDDTSVRVSGVFRAATYPFSSLISVTELPLGRVHWASIEFKEVTPLGRRVHFIPKTRLVRIGKLRWRRIAPVVRELAASAGARYNTKERAGLSDFLDLARWQARN